MSRGSRTANYALGTATNHVAIKNMYIYGGAVWAAIYLYTGLTTAGTLAGALNILVDVYIMKLIGWPWDELLLAETLWGLARSHLQTWLTGWVVATLKYAFNS
jgi:hypothetical protein